MQLALPTKFTLSALAIISVLSGCNSSNNNTTSPAPTPAPTPAPAPAPSPVTIDVNFKDGAQGWTSGFSDYPMGEETFYELTNEIADLPDSSGDTGYRLKGANRSDDLFMFLKLQVTGLESDTQYTLSGSTTFLSNAGVDCFGIGGAPGESVFVKLGASEIEPEQVDFYLNVDKGNQSQEGNDAINIGHVGADGAQCNGESFGEKTIEVPEAEGFAFRSTTDGTIWLFLGSDSGYEGVTDLYYKSLNLKLTPDA